MNAAAVGNRRGVFESPCPPENYRAFEGVAEDGTLLFEIRVHRRAEDRDIVPGLRSWLNRVDPINGTTPKLVLVRGSGPKRRAVREAPRRESTKGLLVLEVSESAGQVLNGNCSEL